MNIKITPQRLQGNIDAVDSKSHAHRLLIAAALTEGDSKPKIPIKHTSADIEATKKCLEMLKEDEPILDCQESGSTLRFLLPVTAALKSTAVFKGEGRLPKRPISPLKEEMEAHGCTFDMDCEICKVTGKLQPGEYHIPGNISSQFITGLLFALPLLPGDSSVEVTTAVESRGYIELTLQVLETFGIEIIKHKAAKNRPLTFDIKGNQQYIAPENISIEGDWSNIAFWLTANAIGSDVKCAGININSVQGDKAIVDILAKYSILGSPYDKGRPITVDASNIPDLIPIVAVKAALSPCITKIVRAERLRTKESNRLKAMFKNLSILGANIAETKDGLILKGVNRLHGGVVSSFNDHRIAMAMAIASTVCKAPMVITGAEAVNKSYPDFFKDFAKLGGRVEQM